MDHEGRDAIERATRQLLQRAGVRSSLNPDDLAEIASQSSSSRRSRSASGTTRSSRSTGSNGEDMASTASPTASTPADARTSNKRRHMAVNSSSLSVASEILDEIAEEGGMGMRRGVGGGVTGSGRHNQFAPSTPRGARAALGMGIGAQSAAWEELDSRIARLTEAVAVAQGEKQLVELDLGRRIRSLEDELLRQRTEAAAAVSEARTAQAAAEARASQLQQNLVASKASFDDLLISAALYETLKAAPRESLSLQQHVQLRVQERLVGVQATIEQLRRDRDNAEERANEAQRGAESRVREAEHARQVSEGREAGLREQVTMHEATIRRLNARLNEALESVEALQGKGAAYDAVHSKLRELELAQGAKDKALAAQEASLQVLRADRDGYAGQLKDLQLKNELLLADKAALQAQAEEARSTSRRLQESLSHAEDRYRDACRQRDAYQEELVRSTGSERQASEERLRSEVQRLREVSSKELEELRAGLKEGYERELRALRDARDEAVSRAERLQNKLDAAQAQHEAAAASRKDQREQSLTAAAELRGLLSVKASEVERLALTNAEQADGIKRLNGEVDQLRARLAAVTAELARKEADSDRVKHSLETALEGERSKVAMYERLEAELDTAIINAGHGGNDGNGQLQGLVEAGEEGIAASSGAGGAGGEFGSSLGLTLAAGVPTTSRRRMRQTITLARELSQSQRDVAALKKQLYEAQRRIEAAEEEAARLRITLDGVQGPPEFLVRQLRALELEGKRLSAALEEQKAQVTGLKRTLAEVEGARQAAEGELKLRRLAASASRQDVQGITALVTDALYMRQQQQQQGHRSADNALPLPLPQQHHHQHHQHHGHHGHHHHGTYYHGAGSNGSEGGNGTGSGISTPLDTASTRSTPPKPAATPAPPVTHSSAHSHAQPSWDLNIGCTAAAAGGAAPSSVGDAATRTRLHSNSRSSRVGSSRFDGAEDEGMGSLTAAEMPFAGGIRYVARTASHKGAAHQSHGGSEAAGAGRAAKGPSVSFSPDGDEERENRQPQQPQEPSSAHLSLRSAVKEVDAPTASADPGSVAGGAANKQPPHRQHPPLVATPALQVAHFGAANSYGGGYNQSQGHEAVGMANATQGQAGPRFHSRRRR